MTDLMQVIAELTNECFFGGQARLIGSNWIMKKSGGLVKAVYFVGVPDGMDFEHRDRATGAG